MELPPADLEKRVRELRSLDGSAAAGPSFTGVSDGGGEVLLTVAGSSGITQLDPLTSTTTVSASRMGDILPPPAAGAELRSARRGTRKFLAFSSRGATDIAGPIAQGAQVVLYDSARSARGYEGIGALPHRRDRLPAIACWSCAA